MTLKIDDNLISRCTRAGRKTSAVAFIILILNGNFWLVKRFLGQECPAWSLWIFVFGAICALFGFLVMLPGLLNPQISLEDSSDDSETTKSDN